jgi:uncharacterized protein with ParB-like and HNH nuclease domain
MEIKADVKRIDQLDDYFFVVPDYQREYVWKADVQVTRFLDDIDNEFDSSSTKNTNYFIGSTIIVKRKDESYDVVDGQQRLTTIVIALCCMRNILEGITDLDKDVKEQLDDLTDSIKKLLYKYYPKEKKKTFRLSLQYEESKNYLGCLILREEFKEERTNSIKRMGEAYQTIHSFLEEYKNIDPLALLYFCSYFMSNVEMVIIIPDNISSALKIFETINERGEGLNAMDLLKNLIFSESKEAEFSTIKDIWKEIIKNLNTCKEGEKPLRFLRYFLIARYHDGIIREDDIYKWIISDEGKNKINYKKNPVKFAKELQRFSKRYAEYVRITNDGDENSNYPPIAGIGYLGKGSTRQHLILLLALNESFTDDIINLLAENIEVLYYYYTVKKVLTKSYEELFASWATTIRNLKNESDIKKFISGELKKEIDRRILTYDIKFPTLRSQDLLPLYRLRYILGRIENYIREYSHFGSHKIEYYESLQIEHILPQTPKNASEKIYGNQTEYISNISKLGNLALVESPINQSLNFANDLSSDNWFSKKKIEYLKSDVLSTKSLAGLKIGKQTAFNKFSEENLMEFSKWDYEEITRRQSILFKLSKKIWKTRI